MTKKIIQRPINTKVRDQLVQAGISPLFAKLYAARGINNPQELETSLHHIIPPTKLTNSEAMAELLAGAIAENKKILIVGDYDADGATATAVAVKGLLSMGAQVDFLVPNRFEYGYGLTPEIVKFAATMAPDVIVTVDNGIASVDGVDAANKLGIQVLITDHHLPGEETPAAACIVNPNQHGCDFPSKNLAGVGVMFYVLLALRAVLRKSGAFAEKEEPNLTELLDLVALGTVADLVKLDANNRILVEQGLRRIRAGASCPGISALLNVAGRDQTKTTAQDFGFQVGPRLNAAGRLDDMRLGIQCLLANNDSEAMMIAQQLHSLNAERRSIEASMQEEALATLDDIAVGSQYSISLFEPSWHQGVVGILASRIKERYHRPVIAFAEIDDGLLKGSGRSIPGLHLRDTLDLVTKRNPTLIERFGGHAMAAGLSLAEDNFPRFKALAAEKLSVLYPDADFSGAIATDGELPPTAMNLAFARTLRESGPWGAGFPEPVFTSDFQIEAQRTVGENHLKMRVRPLSGNVAIDAIAFNQAGPVYRGNVQITYRLDVNEFRGVETVQLIVLQIVSL